MWYILPSGWILYPRTVAGLPLTSKVRRITAPSPVFRETLKLPTCAFGFIHANAVPAVPREIEEVVSISLLPLKLITPKLFCPLLIQSGISGWCLALRCSHFLVDR